MKNFISEKTRKDARKTKKSYFIEEITEKGRTKFVCYRKHDLSVVCESASHETLFRQLTNDGYSAKDIEIF